jgi:hypothetical protein
MRILGRPSWSVLGGGIPLVLVAVISLGILLLPINGKEMGYVGIAYLIFFPVLVLFGIGTLASIACVCIAARRGSGMIWPLITLTLNIFPFWLMVRQFIPWWQRSAGLG